jgi:intracellular sulfur oxidation DsrE/DsrF family protein
LRTPDHGACAEYANPEDTMLYRNETLPYGRSERYPVRRVLVWAAAVLALLVSCTFLALAHRETRADPRLVFPRIHGAGGVLAVGPNAIVPSASAVHRVLVDVDDDATTPEGINARLKTAAKILNLYALAGVPPEKVQMVLLFYGRGVHLALSDAAYSKHFHRANPNAKLLAQLRHAHVKMIACGQALGHQMLTDHDVHPGIQLALSALTTREELQAAGYGSVPHEAP